MRDDRELSGRNALHDASSGLFHRPGCSSIHLLLEGMGESVVLQAVAETVEGMVVVVPAVAVPPLLAIHMFTRAVLA